MNKKASGLVFDKITIVAIGMTAVTVMLFIMMMTNNPIIKGIMETVTSIINNEEKCKEGYFLCEHASKQGDKWMPECIKWGTLGEKGENCNPKNYKPVNFQQGKYDICKDDCKVDYCPAGTGRVGKECKACKNEGEDCGGGVPIFGWGNAGDCCAPEFMECKGSTLGVTAGKCQKRA